MISYRSYIEMAFVPYEFVCVSSIHLNVRIDDHMHRLDKRMAAREPVFYSAGLGICVASPESVSWDPDCFDTPDSGSHVPYWLIDCTLPD